MKRVYHLSLLLCAVLVGAWAIFGFHAYSAVAQSTIKKEIEDLHLQINEKRESVKKLEHSIEQVKRKIEEKELEAVSLQNQLAILENRTTQVELEINATQEKIEEIQLEIEALGGEINLTQDQIERYKQMISEFVRTLHYEQDQTFVEILAAYDNVSEYYNRLQYLQTIEEDLGSNAQSLRIAKTELEQKKELTQDRKASYDVLQAELQQKRLDLEEQAAAKQELYEQTELSSRVQETLLGSLRKQYQQIEGEISSIEREVRKKLDLEEQISGEDSGSMLTWPTDGRYITARFRDPSYPYRHVFEHNAIDIRAAHGTPLRAAKAGYVGRAKHCSSSSCYSYVMIIHSGGISTVYGHMSKIIVSEEQFVTRGDIIGYSGGTPGTVGAGPFVTGPHLHFEVRKNGIPVNPLEYLVKDW